MEPSTGTRTPRRLVDRVAIIVLIGVVAASVGGATLLSVYLNRLNDAAAGLKRVEPLDTYPGRPAPVSVDGVNAVNYLVMSTTADGRLEAVLIAHLSASRRDLTLIALPSDLLVAHDGAGATLAASFAADPLQMARAVESLTGARMDHQVHLDLHGFAGVVDSLGGIDLAGERLDGAGVRAYLAGSTDALGRSLRTADLLRAALGRASMGTAIADPTRFDQVMDALTPCLVVDTDLTSEEIRSTMVESRVRADDVVTWPLAATGVASGAAPDPTGLESLRTALAGDAVPSPVPLATTAVGSSAVSMSPSVTPASGSTTPPSGSPDTAGTTRPWPATPTAGATR